MACNFRVKNELAYEINIKEEIEMILFIVIAIVVLVVLFKKGVFRKEAECQACGTSVKGTEQTLLGPNGVVLCKHCAAKIHPRIMPYAKTDWNFEDYNDYISWEEETKEERNQFDPDYDYRNILSIDMDHGLFSVGSGKKAGMVFRFADIDSYELNFKPQELKEGILGDKVQGDEYITLQLSRPNVYLEEVVNYGVKVRARKKGIISTKFEYGFSKEFSEIVRAFAICVYLESQTRKKANDIIQESQRISEIEKALALFMFDSMDEVTTENLKKQRNALIKAFHPDKNETNEAYSQKINAAYDLLSGMVS